MTELFLYDQDLGLFKQIIKQSTVMDGRYYVVSNTFDINNVALQLTDQKYPCVACMPPRSDSPGQNLQSFFFNLLFLTKRGVTGQNEIKDANPETLISEHPPWYDWKDMNECAMGFHQTLRKVLRERRVADGKPLKGYVSLIGETFTVDRFSNAGNDIVNGVRLSFSMLGNFGCAVADYDDACIAEIEIPDLDIHELHKH